MSYDTLTNSFPYMEGVTLLHGYTPNEAIGDELTVGSAAVPSHPRWEGSEWIDRRPFLGAFRDDVDFTASYRQARLLHDHSVFYGATVKNHALSSERLVTVPDEPPSTVTPSLQSSQEPPKKPGRKRKTQLSERAAPEPASLDSRGGENNDDPSRRGIHSHANEMGMSSGAGIRKQDAKIKKVRERNRVAANKFRTRKKKDLARLQSDEEAIEQRHRTLTSCVDDLNEELLHLKMQLLQHTGCNCTLIQNYIENEAQLYIQSMELESQNYGNGYPQAEDLHYP
ncbi:hypothetical protein B0J15DRAFT_449729 [Fusarium solani]|uniref:BZIP domain-containing protein n=2 Tax=Fusarium solani TaxID=169388 RepID=A0A9P9GZY9_FUSSL|nr:uncharacterized protein B0J15DRAFT_449729 [Fusarium solani]KAH7248476.1 hypothetical protein B0J15DRAFT_449729 [Fusarium solani]